MMELASAYSVTVSPVAWLVYLGSAVVEQFLIERVCLLFREGKSDKIEKRINASGAGGVEARMSVLIPSVVLSGLPSVSLAPSFLVRSRSTKPLSHPSLSQLLRTLHSAAKSFRLVGG